MKFLLAIWLVLLFVENSAQGQDIEYGKPLITLSLNGVPEFVLYEKGQVIYMVEIDSSQVYFEAKLDSTEVRDFLAELLINRRFLRLRKRMDADRWIVGQALRWNTLTLDWCKTHKTISVHGNLRHDFWSRMGTKKEFLFVYDKIVQFRSAKAAIWLPKATEVRFCLNNKAESSIPWPKDLAKLDSIITTETLDTCPKLVIMKNDYSDLIILANRLNRNMAVEAIGYKFQISYRTLFPNIQPVSGRGWQTPY